ncbi:MAG: hypothetical protein U0Y82_16030 [Thermoleophilia bacterium]
MVAAVAGAGGWAWYRATHSTPVGLAAAVGEFRGDHVTAGAMGPGLPAAGVYTYRATGWERANMGPVHLSRNVPAQGQDVVTPSPGGFTSELRLSGEHLESNRYRMRDGALWVTWQRTNVTFLGVGRDDKRTLKPAVLAVPRTPRPGMHWDVSHTSWLLHITGTARVEGTASLTVDGRDVPVVIIRTDTVTKGAHGGPLHQRMWWAPSLGLPVRVVTDTTLSGVVGYRSHIELWLNATQPAR